MVWYRVKIVYLENWNLVEKFSPAIPNYDMAVNWLEKFIQKYVPKDCLIKASIIEGELIEKKPGFYVFKELKEHAYK